MYISANDYQVDEITIYMEIKPRSLSGVLLSIHTKRNYLVLDLINGTVNFKVHNGPRVAHLSDNLNSSNSLCDGQWHEIRGKNNHLNFSNRFT